MTSQSKTTVAPLPALAEIHFPPRVKRPPAIRWGQALALFAFFFVSFCWQETLFRTLVYQEFGLESVGFSSLFSLATAGFLSVICSLGSQKLNRILSLIISTIFSLLFSMQYIYYYFFKVPMSVYSFGQAGQINEFAGDVINAVIVRFFDLALLLLPTVFLLFLGQRLRLSLRSKICERLLLISVAGAGYLAALVIMLALGSGNAAYNLYFNVNDNDNAQRTLGVITNIRLDLQRLAFGFEEQIPENYNDFTIADPAEPAPDNQDKTPPAVSAPEKTDPEPVNTEPEPVNDEPNIMAIDFDALIEDTNDRTIQNMHRYFSEVEPTLKNKYTGLFQDCNLIMLTGESFSSLAVHKEYTPTLYKLANEGFRFTNFYNPIWGVSTSDGEYVACTGLLPKSGVWSFFQSAQNAMPFCLGNQFGHLGGYAQPRAYHNHTYTYYKRHLSHTNIGYDYKGLGNGLEVKKLWPESDLEMMEATLPDYIREDRFHAYYMTVSGHMFYNFFGNAMAARNREAVEEAPYPEEAKAYLAANIELDKALHYLLEELEKAGKLENTVIVLSPDHYPYGLEKESLDALAGHEVEEDFELYQSSLIVWKKGMEPVTVDKPVSSLDILPTLSNLFGLDYDSRLMAGRDIFSDTDGLVIFRNRSWLTDLARYNAKTKEVTPLTAGAVTEDYVQKINREVANRFKYSALILEKDYYRTVYPEKP